MASRDAEEIAQGEGRKLFVGGISFATTDDGLRNYFIQFGKLEASTIMKGRDSDQSRGFGFVIYYSREDADRVVARTDLSLDGRPLHVSIALKRGEEPTSDVAPDNKVFVGGLSRGTTDDGFKNYFFRFGEINETSIMRDNAGISRGFGFVTFADTAARDRAMASSEKLDGRKLDLKVARSRKFMLEQSKSGSVGDPDLSKKVFVKGIGEETTEADLAKHFAQFGEIRTSVVMLDHITRRSRGFGFVTFEDESVARNVCSQSHTLNGLNISCIKALPKVPKVSEDEETYGRQDYGSAPPSRGYGADQRYAPPAHDYGHPPAQGYGAPPPQGYGAPPQQPAYQQPAYQQPAYQQPAYPPAYQQPAYQQPGYGPPPAQPGYGPPPAQPAYAAPAPGAYAPPAQPGYAPPAAQQQPAYRAPAQGYAPDPAGQQPGAEDPEWRRGPAASPDATHPAPARGAYEYSAPPATQAYAPPAGSPGYANQSAPAAYKGGAASSSSPYGARGTASRGESNRYHPYRPTK